MTALITAILRLVDTSTDSATLLSIADAASEAAREQGLAGHDPSDWYLLSRLARLRADHLPKGAS